jgi:hypothetical protein
MKILYYGIFFEKQLIDNIYSNQRLSNVIQYPHVTFCFGKNMVVPYHLIGNNVNINVIGYGLTEDNQGLLVDIPEEYMEYYINKSIPHITLSVSSNGKPKNTGNIKFESIEPFTITGKFGYFTNLGLFCN